MNIIINGSRNFSNYEKLKDVCDNIVSKIQWELDAIHPKDFLVLSGTAQGADVLGERWAKSYNIPVKQFEAKWKDLDVPNIMIKSNSYGEYNALAGHNRNQAMVDYVIENGGGIIISFYKGKSVGSKDCVRRAKKAGLTHYIWDEDKGKMRK